MDKHYLIQQEYNPFREELPTPTVHVHIHQTVNNNNDYCNDYPLMCCIMWPCFVLRCLLHC